MGWQYKLLRNSKGPIPIVWAAEDLADHQFIICIQHPIIDSTSKHKVPFCNNMALTSVYYSQEVDLPNTLNELECYYYRSLLEEKSTWGECACCLWGAGVIWCVVSGFHLPWEMLRTFGHSEVKTSLSLSLSFACTLFFSQAISSSSCSITHIKYFCLSSLLVGDCVGGRLYKLAL